MGLPKGMAEISTGLPHTAKAVGLISMDIFTDICFILQPLSNAYHELAQVYSSNNPAELRNLVNKHGETFTRDNNMGLVKQCLSSLYKKNIQRLTKVRIHTPFTPVCIPSIPDNEAHITRGGNVFPKCWLLFSYLSCSVSTFLLNYIFSIL